MKSLMMVVLLAVVVGLSGCVQTPADFPHTTGTVLYCYDEVNCQEITTEYYYSDDGLVWWDAYYGIWVSPSGYYLNNLYYTGFFPGFYDHYGRLGYWHPYSWGGWHSNWRGGWRQYHGYHGYRGGYHGGGGFRGGHGGHR